MNRYGQIANITDGGVLVAPPKSILKASLALGRCFASSSMSNLLLSRNILSSGESSSRKQDIMEQKMLPVAQRSAAMGE